MEGTVKNWLEHRGFGFIEVDDDENDVFVHYSAIKGADSLMQGQKVEFDVEESYKGLKATNVKIVV